jgi:hypothetical protein
VLTTSTIPSTKWRRNECKRWTTIRCETIRFKDPLWNYPLSHYPL